MRVGVNLRMLHPGNIGGMEDYVRNLIRYVPKVDTNIIFCLFGTDHCLSTFEDSPHISKVQLDSHDLCSLEAHKLQQYNLDLWFCPLLILEPNCPGLPAVINIPDVQHLFFPEFFDRNVLEWRHRHYPRSAVAANAVLTLSEFSRRSICETLRVSPRKVHAIYLDGIVEMNNSTLPSQASAVRGKYGLPIRYVFYPANWWPHKNHRTLLEALNLYDRKYGNCPDLVVTGSSLGHGATKPLATARGEGAYHVVDLGYVPVEHLRAIYEGAIALIFPSLYEGFGIPVVDAMRLGCPVLCSNVTSLPEIAGNAAVYFDPTKPDSICEALRSVLSSESLRADLRERGLEAVRRFSWQETARRTLSVFEEIVKESGRRWSRQIISKDGANRRGDKGMADFHEIDVEEIMGQVGKNQEEVLAALRSLAALQDVYHMSLSSHRRILGPVVLFVKKIFRRILAPIFMRQSGYNSANVTAISLLKDQVDTLCQEQARLRKIVAVQADTLQVLRDEIEKLSQQANTA